MKSVPAVLVASIPGSRTPGAFKFYTMSGHVGMAGIIFRCAGCGEVSTVSFARRARPLQAPWTWDGNRKAPTLTPSIIHAPERGGCGWHGFLRAGRWEPA